MDLRHLRYFICVAEEMHFGRAAERLGISQPPLSQQIRGLEDSLGVTLFERTSRRVRLTEAGTRFLPEARETLAQAERAARTAQRAHRGEIGSLRLGFSVSVPFVPHIMDTLARFRRTYPAVEISIDELARDEQVEHVERGTLDLGILRTFDDPPLAPHVVSTCVQKDTLMLAMRHDHPLARENRELGPNDLRDEPLILFGTINGAGFNEHLYARCERLGFRPKIAMEASSFATLLGLTAAGFGVTVLSGTLARLNVDTLTYRPFELDVVSRLLMIRAQNPSPTTAAFCEMLGAAAQDG
ncbi:LysR family transcriptional regulator [Novosphingobium flavum]|uniref:LysR family transcriptional regulator n=1 Tax=Novosphingobium flavum TaxID=1778672 RepID=A0A7X1KM77_9SPHN|nr:LysR substrate-binding domain-containing protein [Novosphingobium flavum]MBC2666088.1 LysR family transcriptional regulator [Novosphingobium flavum]